MAPEDIAEQYIDSFINKHREQIVQRATWIYEHRPQFTHGEIRPGGAEGDILYDDAQLCYIFGIYSGSIIIGQSAIENLVCGLAYSAEEVGERPSYRDAVRFLEENNILGSEEVDGVPLDELSDLRNPLIHFRPPLDDDRLDRRSVEDLEQDNSRSIAELLRDDAQNVLKTMFSVGRLGGVGSELS